MALLKIYSEKLKKQRENNFAVVAPLEGLADMARSSRSAFLGPAERRGTTQPSNPNPDCRVSAALRNAATTIEGFSEGPVLLLFTR